MTLNMTYLMWFTLEHDFQILSSIDVNILSFSCVKESILTELLPEALQRFVLISSQSESGGLRDKPGRPSDAYHTLYNLSGLSSAQHRVRQTPKQKENVARKWVSLPASSNSQVFGDHVEKFSEEVLKNVFVASMSWEEDEPASRYVGGIANRLVGFNFFFKVCSIDTDGHDDLECNSSYFRFDDDDDQGNNESLLLPGLLILSHVHFVCNCYTTIIFRSPRPS